LDFKWEVFHVGQSKKKCTEGTTLHFSKANSEKKSAQNRFDAELSENTCRNNFEVRAGVANRYSLILRRCRPTEDSRVEIKLPR
jgi:L-cysteine desulfidase